MQIKVASHGHVKVLIEYIKATLPNLVEKGKPDNSGMPYVLLEVLIFKSETIFSKRERVNIRT